jgi:hypothetical protein
MGACARADVPHSNNATAIHTFFIAFSRNVRSRTGNESRILNVPTPGTLECLFAEMVTSAPARDAPPMSLSSAGAGRFLRA